MPRFLGRAVVQVHNPVVVLNDSEPKPDIALLRRNEAVTGKRHAYPADVFGLIEVADSSRDRDIQYERILYSTRGCANTGSSI